MHTTLFHLLDQDATQQPKASVKSLLKRHIRHTSLMLSIHLLNFQILGAQFPKFPVRTKRPDFDICLILLVSLADRFLQLSLVSNFPQVSLSLTMLSQNPSTIHVQMQFPEVFYSRELDSDLVKKDDQKSSWLMVLKKFCAESSDVICSIFLHLRLLVVQTQPLAQLIIILLYQFVHTQTTTYSRILPTLDHKFEIPDLFHGYFNHIPVHKSW